MSGKAKGRALVPVPFQCFFALSFEKASVDLLEASEFFSVSLRSCDLSGSFAVTALVKAPRSFSPAEEVAQG